MEIGKFGNYGNYVLWKLCFVETDNYGNGELRKKIENQELWKLENCELWKMGIVEIVEITN